MRRLDIHRSTLLLLVERLATRPGPEFGGGVVFFRPSADKAAQFICDEKYKCSAAWRIQTRATKPTAGGQWPGH